MLRSLNFAVVEYLAYSRLTTIEFVDFDQRASNGTHLTPYGTHLQSPWYDNNFGCDTAFYCWPVLIPYSDKCGTLGKQIPLVPSVRYIALLDVQSKVANTAQLDSCHCWKQWNPQCIITATDASTHFTNRVTF